MRLTLRGAPRRAIVAAGMAASIVTACTHRSVLRLPDPRTPRADVLATAMIPPNAAIPAVRGTKFGGVSAIAYDRVHDEILGLSDDSENSRVFRMKYFEEPFRVVPSGVVLLERGSGAPRKLDPEGLALLPSGDMLVASEGFGSEEPRIPPAIVQYHRDGRFVRQLPVPPEFLPPDRGPLASGVPSNEAFESLTLTPDGRHLWTGVETALVQDGPVATSAHGSRSRLLEYTLDNGTFVPDREFAYDVDPLPAVQFRPVGLAVSGLVDLVAISDHELIAMERAYVQNPDNPVQDVYRIRIFRVAVDGTQIAPGEASIAGRADIAPVTKTLLLDLGRSRNLPRALAGLDNFEGMAVIPTPRPPRYGEVPALEIPRATAILVSDDNFDARQRTWFVKIAFDPPAVP